MSRRDSTEVRYAGCRRANKYNLRQRKVLLKLFQKLAGSRNSIPCRAYTTTPYF